MKIADINNLFAYHKPTANQAERYQKLRKAAKAFAKQILQLTPESSEQTLAIRTLHQASMLANVAIAVNEPEAEAETEAESEAKDLGEVSDGYHTFNELYEHRHALYLVIANSGLIGSAWKSKKHYDGSSYNGWFLLGIETSEGDISYHLPDALWENAKVTKLERGKKWDGHNSQDVVNRLMRAAQNIA
ncbi:MAG: hypothetical protein F6J93_25740 [Oscillatoria sp. SIO1A7]|nr:hypothetical protein [Oscillatoria sp. SIO1A7]